jgi:YVTN family beta-propeller protein
LRRAITVGTTPLSDEELLNFLELMRNATFGVITVHNITSEDNSSRDSLSYFVYIKSSSPLHIILDRWTVANKGDNSVSIIDGKTDKITNTIKVGISPLSVSVNPLTNAVYVANQGDNTVSVIKNNTIALAIYVGSGPRTVSVNPSTNIVYVANSNDNTISVIDGKTNKVVKTMPFVGRHPYGISANPSTNMVYSSNRESGRYRYTSYRNCKSDK